MTNKPKVLITFDPLTWLVVHATPITDNIYNFSKLHDVVRDGISIPQPKGENVENGQDAKKRKIPSQPKNAHICMSNSKNTSKLEFFR